MRYSCTLLLALLLCTCARAPLATTPDNRQPALSTAASIQSGPMLGYNTMREVAVWVQTTRPATVTLRYSGRDGNFESDPIQTEKSTAYTATLIADQVQPGQQYNYDILVDGVKQRFPYPTVFTAQPLWQHQGNAPDFSVAVGSCAYINDERYDPPGSNHGQDYQIFNSIDDLHPDLMIWLGDNNYLRPADWYSRTGYFHRYTHSRSVPEMQPLLARTHHYAIWDDHDYGPNNSDRSWMHRKLANETFDLFWANPSSGLKTSEQVYGEDGITSSFHYNDIDFFLLDNRSFRTPNDQARSNNVTLLGTPQLDWLIENLVFSQAPWKIVCVGGQVLNSAAVFENYVNLAPNELRYLLARITEENVEGVVFVTGDRHHSELSELKLPNGNRVYDVTISPLTSGVADPKGEVNRNLVPGTLITERNFGVLRFSGPSNARALVVDTYGVDGNLIWTRELKRR